MGANAGKWDASKIAREAAELVPGWHDLSSAAVQPLSGTSRCVFKLSSSERQEAYSVRVLRPGTDRNLIGVSRVLAAAGLTPAVVGFSRTALVQQWIEGTPPSGLRLQEIGAVERLARFVGKFHNVSLNRGMEETPKARPYDLREFAFLLQAPLAGRGLDLNREIDHLEREVPKNARKELVLTHGDLHYGNMVESDGCLWAIDLEMVGPRPRETDLAYLFIMAALRDVTGYPYPSLETRQQFARAYLEECGKPCSLADVEELLFAVERETPFQAMFLGCYFLLHAADTSSQIGLTLLSMTPWARRALVRASTDSAAKQAVLVKGVTSIAFSAQMAAAATSGKDWTSAPFSREGLRLYDKTDSSPVVAPSSASVHVQQTSS